MSLQVWLPLNGSLDNQGLASSANFGDTTAFATTGKLGAKSLYSNAQKTVTFTELNNVTNFSFAYWIKVDSSITIQNWADIIGLQCIVGNTTTIIRDEFTATVGCHQIIMGKDSTVGSNTYTYYGTGASSTGAKDIWTHYAIIKNDVNTYVYTNGILTNTLTNTNFENSPQKLTGKIYLGNTSSTAAQINDVRIYDHCLSPMEVKELSKGLVLHYLLSDSSNQQMNNCWATPTFETSAASGGSYHWAASGASGTQGQSTDKNYIYNSSQIYAHWVANASAATGNYLFCQSPAFEGGYRSFQCICKEENGIEITNNVCYACWNARSGGVANNSWTSIIPLGNGFYWCKCEGIMQDGSNDLVGIYIRPGYKVYFTFCYLENDRTVCSNPFYYSDTIYDCSGYKNNGQIYRYDTTGSIEILNNTPRYQVSTYINSSNNTTNTASGTVYLYGNLSLVTPSQLTIAFWCNPQAGYGSSTGQGQFCTTNYAYGNTSAGSDYQTSTMNHRDNRVDINDSAGTTHIYASIDFTANEWHHYVITYDGQNGRVYKDGTLTTTVSFSFSMALGSMKGVIIGFSKAGGVWRSNKSKYSDFRVYATALSADDVARLYHTSGLVDSSGNVWAREMIEE